MVHTYDEDNKRSIAEAAVKAARETEDLFNKHLSGLDDPYHNLSARQIYQEFTRVKQESRDLAIKIAQYARDFTIDTTKAVSTSLIEKWMQIAYGFQDGTQDMANKFPSIKDRFADLIGDIDERSKATQRDVKHQIDDIQTEIKKYQQMLNENFNWLTSIVERPPPKEELESIIRQLRDEAYVLEDRIRYEDDFQASINDILDDLGKNIAAIGAVWVQARNDATMIHRWLNQALELVRIPSIVDKELERVIAIYKEMSMYLFYYANSL